MSIVKTLFSLRGRIGRRAFWVASISLGLLISGLILVFDNFAILLFKRNPWSGQFDGLKDHLTIWLCFLGLAVWPLGLILLKRWRDRERPVVLLLVSIAIVCIALTLNLPGLQSGFLSQITLAFDDRYRLIVSIVGCLAGAYLLIELGFLPGRKGSSNSENGPALLDGRSEQQGVTEKKATLSATVGGSPQSETGFACLALIASTYRIAADPAQLAHNAGIGAGIAETGDIVRAAKRLDLKARAIVLKDPNRLKSIPLPAIIRLGNGQFGILAGKLPDGRMRLVDPATRNFADETFDAIKGLCGDEIILITRRRGGAGIDPKTFSFKWFLPSIWRYRKSLVNVLVASFFLQLFALVTPLFFQIVIDKVLVHKAYSTLTVIVTGLAALGLFEVILQYLRYYALNHTTSRIDVELGSRLFDHLLRLPISYFETRPAGQTVARAREIETIRSFLTGQGLSSAIDVMFTFVFIAVLFFYSTTLTLIVLISIPFYVVTALMLRPLLREKINERFNTGAASQQFLVESVFGIQTLKAAAVEPMLRNQWEEKLASYVRSSFHAVTISSVGQNIFQFINKAAIAAVLFLGAQAVIDGTLTIGALIAFNMIMGQVTAPILRLSQLWQDFQQVQTSVERLGDILNSAPESARIPSVSLPTAKGAIAISDVNFRYEGRSAETLKGINLNIPAGQVIGIVGPSGSGKSTLAKLILRLYVPEHGQITIDGIDIGQVDSAWLRRQIGIVLQESTLFNRTIHENIALAEPSMTRGQVISVARLSGADEFISKLPLGYETRIEERGANLSGGQRQRIAIARALATKPRILIFDEATSALDYESEQIIQKNMRQIVQGRTVIIIAHRLATVRKCDRIVAIHDGAIVEDGSHRDLIRRPEGIYANLWRMQSDSVEDAMA